MPQKPSEILANYKLDKLGGPVRICNAIRKIADAYVADPEGAIADIMTKDLAFYTFIADHMMKLIIANPDSLVVDEGGKMIPDKNILGPLKGLQDHKVKYAKLLLATQGTQAPADAPEDPYLAAMNEVDNG